MGITEAKTPRGTYAVYEGNPVARSLGEVSFQDAWRIEGDPERRSFLSMFDAVKGEVSVEVRD